MQKNTNKDIYTKKCRPIVFTTTFPSNKLCSRIDAVFPALSEDNVKNKEKNEEHSQKLKILEL